ncbi:MAG: reverse transcriptase/maturase family protein [Nanoarchaeota archaeon]
MHRYRDLWLELCSYENLFLAYKKARKHKTTKDYVLNFEKDLQHNLWLLRSELLLHSYRPKPLVSFIIRDPKIRKISKSDFRDRIVHHALCNVIGPIFEKSFIYDSYANRKGKGTLKAIERFETFRNKVSKNNKRACYVLKADVKKYFETVNQDILIKIIQQKIKDKKVLWLVKKILMNSANQTGGKLKGMPLGNLTSQFFANIYLNELDHFAKEKLKVKYYIRYVDDFVILHAHKEALKIYKIKIGTFLKQNLDLDLHPDKSKIIRLGNRLNFLGFRIFNHHKLIKKQNLKKIKSKFLILKKQYQNNEINYDIIYGALEGWIAHIKYACTYKLRKNIIHKIEQEFFHEISTKEINRLTKSLTNSP